MVDFTGVKVMLVRRHMTQKRLAEIAKIRPTTLSRICLGQIDRLPVDVLDKMCKVLDCQPGDLMEYVPDPAQGCPE